MRRQEAEERIKGLKAAGDMHPGDVYLTRMPDGRYGAVRVLRVLDKSALVCVTPYLGVDKPTLADPLLRCVLEKNRFSFGGRPALAWRVGKPPPRLYSYLGNLPATAAEAQTECNVYGGGWSLPGLGWDVYYEWRWRHDREAYEAEVRQKQAERPRATGPDRSRRLMPDEEFWRIIALLDWQQSGDDEAVIRPAVARLAKMPVKEIEAFQEALACKLYQLDTKAHARHIGEYACNEREDYVSADGFLYARCAAVANGREVYERARLEPAAMPEDIEFEMLLYVAQKAYEQKTGRDFEYETGYDFETFANREGWA